MDDLYQTLGVERNASPDEIKRAYRKCAKKHHPDAGGDRKDFEAIQLAFEVLSDVQRREVYDETGEVKTSVPEALSIVLSMIKGAFAQEREDPIRMVEKSIERERADLRGKRNEVESAIGKMERNLDKFQKRKVKGNGEVRSLIIEAVESNIATAKRDIEELNKLIEFCGEKLELLNGLRSNDFEMYSTDAFITFRF